MKKFTITLIIILAIAFVKSENDNIVVIDAGSSGSRCYIWQDQQDGSFKELGQKKDKDNLAKLADVIESPDQSAAQKEALSLKKLCEGAKNNQNLKISQLYILSTAGSRDKWIAQASADKVQGMLDQTGIELAKHLKELFQQTEEIKTQVAVVTGRMEGIYGFLSLVAEIKSDKKRFDQVCAKNDLDKCIRDIIFTEIGGSSTQVVFIKTVAKIVQRFLKRTQGIVKTTAAMSEYLGLNTGEVLYSKSFLGNGGDRLWNLHVNATVNDCSKYQEEGLFDANTMYEPCLKELNNIKFDHTQGDNAGDEYLGQYKKIQDNLKNNKKSTWVLNSNGVMSFFAGERKFLNYQSIDDAIADIKSQKDVKLLFHSQVSSAYPQYFAENLKLDFKTTRFVPVSISWTQGGLLNNKFSGVDKFSPKCVNSYEDQDLDLNNIKQPDPKITCPKKLRQRHSKLNKLKHSMRRTYRRRQ